MAEMIEVTTGDIPQLVIGGVALPIIVFLLVHVMVYVGLLKTGQQKRIANVLLSLLGGIVWLIVSLIPEWSGIVGLIVVALVGSLGSALLYTKFGNSSTDDEE